MPNDPILHLLGLARKAGRLEIGEEPVGAVCRARQARLVLLASDAAPNTCRRAAHFGEAGNVLWLEVPFTKAELGFALGRGSCAMLALTDAGFAASLTQKLAAGNGCVFALTVLAGLTAPPPSSSGRRPTGSFSGSGSSGSTRKTSGRARRPPGLRPRPSGTCRPSRTAGPLRRASSPRARPAAAPLPIPPPPAAGTASAPPPAPAVPISPALAAAGCPASSGTIPKK